MSKKEILKITIKKGIPYSLGEICRKVNVGNRIALINKLKDESPILESNINKTERQKRLKRYENSVYNPPSGEKRILELLAVGYDNIEIAQDMGLTPKTVKQFLLRIGNKMGIKNKTRKKEHVRQRITAKARELGIVPEIEPAENKLHEPLSDIEVKILNLMKENPGIRNIDLAEQLNMGNGTIKTHLTNIFNKFGCSNRHQAIIRFEAQVKAGFIPELK